MIIIMIPLGIFSQPIIWLVMFLNAMFIVGYDDPESIWKSYFDPGFRSRSSNFRVVFRGIIKWVPYSAICYKIEDDQGMINIIVRIVRIPGLKGTNQIQCFDDLEKMSQSTVVGIIISSHTIIMNWILLICFVSTRGFRSINIDRLIKYRAWSYLRGRGRIYRKFLTRCTCYDHCPNTKLQKSCD